MGNIFFSIESFFNEGNLGFPRRWLKLSSIFWLRPLIIVGVLLLSAAFSFIIPRRFLILIPILLFGIVAVLIFMHRPSLGLISLIGSTLILLEGPSGINITVVLVGLLLGLWFLDMFVHQRKIAFIHSITVWPLLALIIIVNLAFGIGLLPWYNFAQSAPFGAQLGGLAIFILSAGGFVLVAHQIRQLRWLKWMIWVFLAIVSLYIVGRIIPGLDQFTGHIFNITNTGSLFWVWGAALAFSQAIFNVYLHRGWRFMLGGLTLAILYVGNVLIGDWQSGWLPALASLVAVIGFRYWKKALLLLPFGIVAAGYLVNYLIGVDEYSYSTRIEAWSLIAEITKINPILGLGPANYRWYTPFFPIRGYSVYYFSHSQYIDLYAQTGVLGLIAFLWFFGAVGLIGWRLRNNVPVGFPRAYVYGALGGVVGMLVSAALGDWVIPFFYNVGFNGFRTSILGWLFLGGLVALEQMTKQHQGDEELLCTKGSIINNFGH